ncbi:MAG TPA: M48 family metalloprotease, partial [Planctomycetota bacterium]|nr:M48 family metalloprotease [Planctomycetota bacterium]
MRKIHSLLAVFALAISSVACATDRQVIAQASNMHQELEPAVIEEPQLANYLQTMGRRVVAAARELDSQGFGPKSHKKEDDAWMFSDQMSFHFVNSDTMNAFTTGGTHMYIYTKLLSTCTSEDELAAVVAHEYGHVYARHVHKGMNRQYLALGGAAAVGVGAYLLGGEKGEQYAPQAAALGLAAGQFLNMGYTRDDESEADKLGFAFYTRAGWDPDHFGDFFQRMVDMGLDTQPEMLSDHPSLASRVEDAKKRAANLPASDRNRRKPPVADEAKFHALQQRAVALAKTMPSDKSLEAAK